MKSLIRWAISNTPAMNTLMLAIIVVGIGATVIIRREVFPEFELEIILINVPYPGASPEEVEEGICEKIEEAVFSIEGIDKLSSVSREGMGTVIIELKASVKDVQKKLNEVRSEVDRIPSMPVLAEDPEVTQITFRSPAIRIGILAPAGAEKDELELRRIAERVRNDLLLLPSVTQASVIGGRDFQIDVEIAEATLRRYGKSLRDVAMAVRRENMELPGGKMTTDSQEILLRGKNKGETGEEIENVPLVTDPSGVVLTVEDIGTVRDEFIDSTAINYINGRPGLTVSVDKTSDEDLLQIVSEVNAYLTFLREAIQESKPGALEDAREKIERLTGQKIRPLPLGYDVAVWNDRSIMVEERMELLARNGLQGLVLVFVVLALFLERRLAFWVAMGIPISMFGAMAILFAMGQTLNMLSMFAFLMALGILVDDAIVVGENVYSHRQMGKPFVRAAIDGTYEVMPSVLASVTTTIIAFSPLLFVPGIMGKFIAVMPLAVIVMLLISLFESTFILPCHLAHSKHGDDDPNQGHGKLDPKSPFLRGYRRACRPGFFLPWAVCFGLAISAVVVSYQAGLWERLVALSPALAGMAFHLALAAFGLLLLIAVAPFLFLPLAYGGLLMDKLNDATDNALQWFINRIYTPVLRFSLVNPTVVAAGALALLLITFGIYRSGIVPWNGFPKLDGSNIQGAVTYPDGTPGDFTELETRRMLAAIQEIDEEYGERMREEHGADYPLTDLVKVTHFAVGEIDVSGEIRPGEAASGAFTGAVAVELVETNQREVSSEWVVKEWRKRAGDFPGAESVVFGAQGFGPGGAAIEFKMLAQPEQMEQMEAAIEAAKKKLAEYPGVFDIRDNSRPGKWEYQLKVNDRGKSLGVTVEDIAQTVRSSYYGEEVMRLQRGRHEVKLMVRYPKEERQKLAKFDELRVRVAPPTGDLVRELLGGAASGSGPYEIPLTDVAEITVERGYSEINRTDQLRSITVTADIDEARANASNITRDMQKTFMPTLLAQYPGVQIRWEGQAEQTAESLSGLMIGLVIALFCMFALLTLQFRSYLQPVIIMLIIPFGVVGAVFGHMFLQLPLTLFSVFGLVALTGVVVNDSIVLIDFINHRVRDGMPLREALIESGRRRFRPVLLTSATTIAGLLPILLETSLQAQVLIPMATSLAFGLMFSTVLVLVIAPTWYEIYAKIFGVTRDHAADGEDRYAGPVAGRNREMDEASAPGDRDDWRRRDGEADAAYHPSPAHSYTDAGNGDGREDE